MKKIYAILGIGFLAGNVACGDLMENMMERDDEPQFFLEDSDELGTWWEDESSESHHGLLEAGGDMSGTMGPIAVEGDITQLEATTWFDTEVRGTTINEDGTAAMVIITFLGGLDRPEFAVGATVEHSSYWEQGTVNVLGCSGQEVDNWDYDREPEQARVSIREVAGEPDLLAIDFEATMDGGFDSSQVVTGTYFVDRTIL